MLKSGPMDIGAVGNWGTCGANEIADLWFFTKGLSIVVFPFTRFHKSPNSLSDQGLYKALMQVGLSLVVVSLADTSIILGSTLRPLGSFAGGLSPLEVFQMSFDIVDYWLEDGVNSIFFNVGLFTDTEQLDTAKFWGFVSSFSHFISAEQNINSLQTEFHRIFGRDGQNVNISNTLRVSHDYGKRAITRERGSCILFTRVFSTVVSALFSSS
eukprot:Em0113g6a